MEYARGAEKTVPEGSITASANIVSVHEPQTVVNVQLWQETTHGGVTTFILHNPEGD